MTLDDDEGMMMMMDYYDYDFDWLGNGKIEKIVKKTLQTEYNNEITNVGIYTRKDYKYAYTYSSFEYEDSKNRNRDEIISMIGQKNRLMTEQIRKNLKLQKLVFRILKSTICACKNGKSVEPDCDSYTVDPECVGESDGRCYGQPWYYYMSLAAGIDLYIVETQICLNL